MTLLLGALCFCLLGSGACLDIKTESFEDLLHAGNAGALQGVGAWTKIFQSFGRGERMDADQLSKLAKVPKEFGPTSQVQVDPNFGLQLGEEKIQELRHLKDKPEDLMKLVNENPLVQQMAAQDPAMKEIISSPEALQTLLSDEALEELRRQSCARTKGCAK
ncbi:Peptidylprolyl isomerase [Durusdinium trenchii]|uniref:Peptidylprolyl isomerase n=1 Tax=Durusdinium trenchii TaxID=1381693 RepID=A0ABP0R3B0_9DINO